VTVRVPAKANLFLAVRGRRADGYHELVTVLQTLSVYDEVIVAIVGPPGQRHHPAGRRRMAVVLEAAHDLPSGDDNLAMRAAAALSHAVPAVELLNGPVPPGGVQTLIELRKSIPVAGGMAGGSADAAGALLALNELWGCDLDRTALRQLAEGLGSDVPFCVMGGTALATGRGTRLAQVLCRGAFDWVVCTADEPLETADVYRAWDRHCQRSEVEPDAVLQALRNQDPVALGAALHNDLEPAAFALRPALEDAKKALLDEGALGAVLAGSGPTLLGLCENAASARQIGDRVAGMFRETIVARSPAGGPETQHG
jgi:4-diphosphocytidyl-2-C-methyl-D-erythritol kinase